MKKGYLVVLFALVLVAFIGFSVASGAGGGGGLGILGPGISVYITYPASGAAYNHYISNFSWSITPWTDLASCWYTLNSGTDVFVNCADNFSSFGSSLTDGTYDLHFVANKTVTQIWDDNLTFFVDTTAPSFSAFNANPADSVAYASGQFYEFSVNVSDAGAGVGSVWYEFNGINYTDVYNSGSTYYFNRSDLAVGNYNYRWYANDSLGNFNQSGVYAYTIVPADPTSGMSIVGDDNITYGEYTDFVGVESNSGDGGCNYSLTPSNDTLFGAGTVVFTLTTTGCANYTAGSVTRNLTVNQAVPVLVFLANGGTVNLTLTYGESANISAAASGIISGNVVSVGLDRDGTSVLGENGLDVILAGNKTYSYRANITGNQNYSDVGYSYLSVVVNRTASITTLSVNPASPIVYGNTSNFSCSNSAGLPLTLYINGSDASAEMGLEIVRAAGAYDVNCTSSDNENYTRSSDSLTYGIDRAVPSLSLSFSPGSSVSAGTATNVSGLGCPVQLSDCKLYRNGVEVNNSDFATLGAGTYSYEFNTTGNENYTNASIIGTLTVKSSYSGSGGSGYRYSSCDSNWTCTDWGPCKDGLQVRECSLVDERCYSSGSVPYEAQVCNIPGGLNNSESNVSETPIRNIIDTEPESRAGAGITGGAIGALSSGGVAAIAVLAIVVLAAYGYILIRRRNFQNSLERTLAGAK